MSLDEFKYAVDELISIGIDNIQIIGGEPGCSKLLKEMVLYSTKRVKSLGIFTNLTLFSDEDIEWFATIPNLKFRTSIYSYIAEQHDLVTTFKGSHLKTVSNLEKMEKLGISCKVACTEMGGIECGYRDRESYDLSIYHDYVRHVGVADGKLFTPNILEKKFITQSTFKRKLKPNNIKRAIKGLHNCYSKFLYIDSKLEVFPCSMERNISYGRLVANRTHLGEILNEKNQKYNSDKFYKCIECEFQWCCYNCPPDSFDFENGKPWFCTYNPEIGKWEDKSTFMSDLCEKIQKSKN